MTLAINNDYLKKILDSNEISNIDFEMILSSISTSHPIDLKMIYDIGIKLYNHSLFLIASKYLSYKLPLHVDSSFLKYYSCLANCFWKLDKMIDAKKYYEIVIQIKPSESIYHNLGVTEIELCNYQSSLTIFEKGLSINPSNHDILFHNS